MMDTIRPTARPRPTRCAALRLPANILAILVFAASAVTAAAKSDIAVDVELVIAVDVSRSMTPRELEIQRRGYAEALVSDEVVQAIMDGPRGQVALMYVEWAGWQSQRIIVDWTLVRTRADAEAFAAKLTTDFSSALRRTSISGLLDYAARAFEDNGFSGFRQVIDISGDGPNNQGRPVEAARDDALARGVVINGLPLMTREGMGVQWHLDDLDEYYRHCVIGGPTAFVIPVLEWKHFPEAVRRKLILELVGRFPRIAGQPALIRPIAAGYDCLIGEKIWDEIMDDWN